MKAIKYLNFLSIGLSLLSVVMILMYLLGISLFQNVYIVISVIVSLSVAFISAIFTMVLSHEGKE